MKTNIENCINQIIKSVELEGDFYSPQIFSINEFIENLKELRDRKDVSQAHQEFFKLYVFNDTNK